MDGGTRARVEEEKALDSSRLRSSARLGFASSSSAGSSRIARRKRKKRRRQQRRSSNVDDEDELVVVGGGAGAGAGGGCQLINTVNETTVDATILVVKEEQQQQNHQHQSAVGQTISSEESTTTTTTATTTTTRQSKNRLSHTNESQRNVTRGGSSSRAAASSLNSGNTLLNRRAAGKRSSRRCNANARRNAMTMDLQRLITEVHARPAIWDQKNVNYHNRDVILKMWREIARACEVSSEYTPRFPLPSSRFPLSSFLPPSSSLFSLLSVSSIRACVASHNTHTHTHSIPSLPLFLSLLSPCSPPLPHIFIVSFPAVFPPTRYTRPLRLYSSIERSNDPSFFPSLYIHTIHTHTHTHTYKFACTIAIDTTDTFLTNINNANLRDSERGSCIKFELSIIICRRIIISE